LLTISPLWVGFFLAAVLAALSYLAGALSFSGSLAALALGTVVFGIGGWSGTALLLTFFVTSSLLSRAFRKRKARTEEKYAKGSRRDAGQVLANGGLAGVLILAWWALGKPDWIWLAVAASLAAVNADTWATELGVLSRRLPRRIASGELVPFGTSGAISLVGTLAALGGAMLVGCVNFAFDLTAGMDWKIALLRLGVINLAGLAGSLVDSLLGDTIQAVYYCPTCQKDTERHPVHSCGASTDHVRGWQWLNNDWVNFACSLSASLLAALAAFLI